MSTTTIDRVTIYRAGGIWCYSAWCGSRHDHNDTLQSAESEEEVRSTIEAMFPDATVVCAEDVQHKEYGPCHWCGSETPERHGSILVGCCPIDGDTVATVEVCDECRANPPETCPN